MARSEIGENSSYSILHTQVIAQNFHVYYLDYITVLYYYMYIISGHPYIWHHYQYILAGSTHLDDITKAATA